MNGSQLRNIVVLILVNLVIKPLWIFGIEITIQNKVGGVVYGQYGALLFLSFIFQVLLDLGLQTYNTQKIAQKPNRIAHIFPTILVAKLALALIYLVIVMSVAWYMGYDNHALYLLLFLCIAQICNSYALYIRSCITALQHYSVDILLSVLDRGIMILICGYLLFAPDVTTFKIEWLVYTQVAAYFLSASISLWIVLSKTKLTKFSLRLQHILPIIKSGLPFAVLILLMSLFMRGDLIILERLNVHLDPSQAGKYYEAYRLIDAANNFSGILLASWLLPMFAVRIQDDAYIKQLSSSAYRLLIPLSIALCIFCYFFGEQVMSFFYNDYSYGDGVTLFLFMMAFPFYCLTYIYSSLNTARNDIKQLIGFAVIAFIYNLVSNLIFAPKYGVTAVAINCIITQAIYALCNLGLSYRNFKMQIPFQSLGRIAIFSILIAAICYVLYRFEITLIPALVIIICLSIIMIFGIRIFSIGELKRFQQPK